MFSKPTWYSQCYLVHKDLNAFNAWVYAETWQNVILGVFNLHRSADIIPKTKQRIVFYYLFKRISFSFPACNRKLHFIYKGSYKWVKKKNKLKHVFYSFIGLYSHRLIYNHFLDNVYLPSKKEMRNAMMAFGQRHGLLWYTALLVAFC